MKIHDSKLFRDGFARPCRSISAAIAASVLFDDTKHAHRINEMQQYPTCPPLDFDGQVNAGSGRNLREFAPSDLCRMAAFRVLRADGYGASAAATRANKALVVVSADILPEIADGTDLAEAFGRNLHWIHWPFHDIDLMDDPDFQRKNSDIDPGRWRLDAAGPGAEIQYAVSRDDGETPIPFTVPPGCESLPMATGQIMLGSIIPGVIEMLAVGHEILIPGVEID